MVTGPGILLGASGAKLRAKGLNDEIIDMVIA
jgi:hypothetical protein